MPQSCLEELKVLSSQLAVFENKQLVVAEELSKAFCLADSVFVCLLLVAVHGL